MSIDRNAPSQPRNHTDPSHADTLRRLLKRAGLSQREAARRLTVDERTMRQWCAGQGTPPASVFRALSPKLTHAEHLRELIESNEQRIEAMESGRITYMGDASSPSDPTSVSNEIRRLRKQNEEHRSLVRLEDALDRRREAHAALFQQWLPQGNGLPTEESLAELDAAEQEVRAAQAEVDRITQEIRAGLR